MGILLLLICTFVAFIHGQEDNIRWQLVEHIVQNNIFFQNMALSVGADERMFTSQRGKMTMDSPMNVASSTKMISSSMFFQAVDKGLFGFDDYVSDYIDFWSKDPNDPTSRVRVRDVLTFSDGFNIGVFMRQTGDPCDNKDDFNTCFQKSYEAFNVTSEPGTVFDYNEFHLQILGYILSNLTNTSIEDLVAQQLKSLNMTSSYYTASPDLSSALTTTGTDYEQYMMKLWNGDVMSEESRGQMFRVSQVAPKVMPCNTTATDLLGGFVGPYSWTNWMECPFWKYSSDYPNIPQKCLDQKVHSDPGIFGYWPSYDLGNDYWYQVVVQGLPIIACAQGMLLRVILKPFLNLAVTGHFQGTLPKLPSEADWQYYGELIERFEEHLHDVEEVDSIMKEAYLHFVERGYLDY